jgi:tRNA (mo5U34)-methyltransferase
MDTDTLRKKVAEIDFWYHRIELPGGVTTTGVNPLNAAAFRVPADLTGKRVLDVGAWDGYWTFEALKRGAREVVAIDDFSDYLGELRTDQRHAWKSFDLCREALGHSEDRCKRIEIDLYEIDEHKLGGRFDVVLFFGTLYHLRHPLLGLDRLASVCNEGAQIIVESQICDDFSAYRGLGRGYAGDQMVAEFFPTNQLAGNPTNWWAPTLACLRGLLQAAGFSRNLSSWKLFDRPAELGQCRGLATGFKAGR